MIAAFRRVMGRHTDLFLIVGVVGVLTILFAPIPGRLLDLLLIVNFSCALLLLLLTFYVRRPLDFSTFPSLLLIATLFRLGLNVAATRLILGQADAGRVIGAIGSYVVGGNYVIGLIVFLILVVVQYVVVTSGAQRVAEVAARFTLDSMPGHQMSIDADLNMGFIDQAEAQRRRKDLEREASFYGSMDGASKFVKGDAIAGILILLIDIFGGLAVGIAQQGLGWGDALQTYTLLTVGDAIVTQVPALVIAVGTGIIVTRSATDRELNKEVFAQVTAFPKSLALVALAVALLAMLPGIPAAPVLLVLAVFAGGWFFVRRGQEAEPAEQSAAEAKPEEDLQQLLQIDPLEVDVGSALAASLNGDDAGLLERLAAFRRQFAADFGLVVPSVRFRESKRLAPQRYQLRVYGAMVGEGELLADRLLAIHPAADCPPIEGLATHDPSYGLPATWIEPAAEAAARQAGFTVVDAQTVFMTHLTESIRRHAASLVTRGVTEALVERVRKTDASLVEELVPNVLSLSDIQKVLQALVREKVPVKNLAAILEVLADAGRANKDVDALIELVRQRLGAVLCQSLADGAGQLMVLTLDTPIEQQLSATLRATGGERPGPLVLDPSFAEQLLSRLGGQVLRMVESNHPPVLLCPPELRKHLRRLTERLMPHLSVLSMSEVPPGLGLRSYAVVKL